ncbi:neutral zinc metallopeptidase [Chitinophaga sp. XS-30]|uniref:KPN_02809 family neutral zinc metallopeptidase n=1 Tax=Chitinophaga sp. XS-30 TaxID=2604421 RepID=UPI0011DDB757|nr:neutral zinc metallopeptidase [Chitinophaga sp. XS-30]QEH40149.1 metalloprotease [Chitinophaga sp. XS-30]
MRWQGRRESGNVEDRRGASRGGLIAGGGIGGIVIALLIYFLGGDPSQVMNMQQAGPQQQLSPEQQAAENEAAGFVKVVLAETEDVWNKVFSEMGQQYREPTLVLFTGVVESACGNASSASGPFYCPADEKVYIDLSFYDELHHKLNAPGDFAMAYVIAHEVGHHIQKITGISDKVQRMRGRVSETEYNKLSVKLELQADFLAGVWAHHTQQLQNIIEPGDIEEALNAANAIGDDRLQQQAQGYVVPDAFTHGTSRQRMYWFKKGFETGDIRQGDTFSEL